MSAGFTTGSEEDDKKLDIIHKLLVKLEKIRRVEMKNDKEWIEASLKHLTPEELISTVTKV